MSKKIISFYNKVTFVTYHRERVQAALRNNMRYAQAHQSDPKPHQPEGYPDVVIHCADSRVNFKVFTQSPGPVITITNAGNQALDEDLGYVTSLTQAFAQGKRHISIIGHTHCGAIGGALSNGTFPPALTQWLAPIQISSRQVLVHDSDDHDHIQAMSYHNVMDQAKRLLLRPDVQALKNTDHPVVVSPFVYDITTGRLTEVSLPLETWMDEGIISATYTKPDMANLLKHNQEWAAQEQSRLAEFGNGQFPPSMVIRCSEGVNVVKLTGAFLGEKFTIANFGARVREEDLGGSASIEYAVNYCKTRLPSGDSVTGIRHAYIVGHKDCTLSETSETHAEHPWNPELHLIDQAKHLFERPDVQATLSTDRPFQITVLLLDDQTQRLEQVALPYDVWVAEGLLPQGYMHL